LFQSGIITLMGEIKFGITPEKFKKFRGRLADAYHFVTHLDESETPDGGILVGDYYHEKLIEINEALDPHLKVEEIIRGR
jgi:hypothetical protein